MQIDGLKAFCAVCEYKSLSEAARKMGISTPKMTRLIQQVEAELDTLLLHRTTRAVTPTDAGELFYQQTKELIQQYDASVQSLETLSSTVSGTIKIGVPASIASLWITPTLHKLTKQYPDLNIRLVNGNHLLDLLSDGFDLIIHCGQLPDSGFYYQKLCDWHKVTCASPGYLKKNETPKKPADLIHHNCIDHYDNFKNTWKYNIKGKEESVFIEGNIKANSSLDLKNIALSGLGVVYLPSFTVERAIKAKKLMPVLQKFTAASYEMFAVYPSEKLSNKVKFVLTYLNEILKEE